MIRRILRSHRRCIRLCGVLGLLAVALAASHYAWSWFVTRQLSFGAAVGIGDCGAAAWILKYHPEIATESFPDTVPCGSDYTQLTWTWLHRIAYRGGSVDCMRALVEAGADLEAKDDEDGRTPLLFEVGGPGDPRCMEYLLQAGSNPNAKTAKHGTPLLFYAQTAAAASLLLRYGADPNARDGASGTFLTTNGPWQPWLPGDTAVSIATALLAGGADPNLRAEGGMTWLHRLVEWTSWDGATEADLAMITLAIKSGSNVNAVDDGGMTPMDYCEDAAVAALLRKAGAKTSEELQLSDAPTEDNSNPVVVPQSVGAEPGAAPDAGPRERIGQ